MRLVCSPLESMPPGENDCDRIVLYNRAPSTMKGSAGSGLIEKITRKKLAPAARTWDFLSIALSVIAADENCHRRLSCDGWTRQFELSIAVSEPEFWNSQTRQVESLLNFLTGDIWLLTFIAGGFQPTYQDPQESQSAEAVCLLSGGMDSLIGALDLTDSGRRLYLVSQIAMGDKKRQRFFAETIAEDLPMLQLNHLVTIAGPTERSQRARSMIFIAYGILAATALDRYRNGETVDLFIPENGFISLNIPMTPLRLGSLSTRTTHPVYMGRLQRLFDAAEIRVKLINPYQFKTKGEMLTGCRKQEFLKTHVFSATSCGRFPRTGFQHCGRCTPCLVRRSAIHRWGIRDDTRYRFGDLSIPDHRHRDFDDVRAALMAVAQVRNQGINRWTAGAINSAQLGDVTPYLGVAERGIGELGAFLEAVGAM